MNIGVIGAGAIGSAIARKLARNGIKASISNARGPQSLQTLVHELGPNIKAATVKEAAQADLVFVAVPWGRLPDALKGLGPWNGRILVDANNAVEIPSLKAVNLGGRASSEVVAQLAPGAHVVKAFNTLIAAVLDADPRTAGGGRRVLFLAGQDADAKKTVSDLIARLGFAPVDLGGVNEGRLTQFPGGPLAILNLTSQAPVDYDRLMQANLVRVFGERDDAKRMEAISELYAEDAVLYEPQATLTGRAAISGAVTVLLASLPSNFTFRAAGPALGHNGVGRLQWRVGAPEGPVAMTGMDVAHFEGGLIRSLHVFLDPPGP